MTEMRHALPDTAALIVAAGRGTRIGAELPKQFLPLGGKPLLRHALEVFAKHPEVGLVRAVIHPDDRDLYDEAAVGLDLAPPVAGGDTRQASVLNGLRSLEAERPQAVMIHDGARPFIEAELISSLRTALQQAPGAIAALPVVDSLKRGTGGEITCSVEREGLWRAQTPQAFRYDDILAAHERAAGGSLTDDAAVAAEAGLAVRLVQGSAENIKVTTSEDLALAERWLLARSGLGAEETRVGQGFDVHRFGPGDQVILCGVKIPHGQCLLGHSDADVGLHAVTDALLGGLAAGDIGSHFPPSDAQWAGADSALFLRHAAALLREAGGRLCHLDITVICEAPKIGPHRQAMQASVAALLEVAPERVSIKATTTEGLGFTGRGEGIAVQATATLALPRRPPT
jgi:2-C-methyl-D-erythritol 4-phosphate cytidylyltransferase/2-C-methyl-D-erythritol 2,4-cyclodiphosphate synthase